MKLISFRWLTVVAVTMLLFAFYQAKDVEGEYRVITAKTSVEDLLIDLGKAPVSHYMDVYDSVLAQVGEQLIREGQANYGNHKGKRISSHFQCTDCHSLVKEGTLLTTIDPQQRLDYTQQHTMPFLPGSTLHGLYNRTDFYNDDYYKKYGSLVFDARNNLGNAIQLCAEYCASGRPLEDWELEAMLHYFKREELTLEELQLSSEELQLVQSAVQQNDHFKEQARAVVEEKYVRAYRATFTGAMPESDRKYGSEGNSENGKKIYEASCLYCHQNARVTYLDLDRDILSARYLWNNRKGYEDQSIYQVIRWGTYPKAGRRQYMPLYTEEKLSDQQLEDLMAYIKEQAGK
jgi:mono/diheme cytochrome c family protein